VTSLEAGNLLTASRDALGNPQFIIRNLQSLDAHPHLREYFAKSLREQKPDAWRTAHRRLYEHLCATTKEGDQPTLEDLQPLYQAVAHGCRAGLQQAVFDNTYWPRIQRRKNYYPTKQLGAIGAELVCVSAFFVAPWTQLDEQLSYEAAYEILDGAAEHLHSLGRLQEASDVAALLLARSLSASRWHEAASGAILLSEIAISRGLILSAKNYAMQAIELADRCGNAFHAKIARVCLANSLYQHGDFSEAMGAFVEAEEIQRRTQPCERFLLSLQGCDYCELLLDFADTEEESHRQTLVQAVRERAVVCIDKATTQNNLLPRALAQLIAERCDLAEKQGGDVAELRACCERLDKIIYELRQCDVLRFICRAFLVRARVKAAVGDTAGAHSDLDEAFEIATRGPLALQLADVHLLRARLFSEVRELERARILIGSCEYGRRHHELTLLSRILGV
jgi:hypothetical protein